MIGKTISKRKELRIKTKLLKKTYRELINIHFSMEKQKEYIERFLANMSELKEITDKSEFEAIMLDINAEMEQLGVFINFGAKDKERDYSPEIV